MGVVLIAHGLQKLFGWWGGPGLDGFKNSLADVGYQHADILAYVGAGGADRRRRAAGAGPVHPAGRGGRAGLPDQRPAGRVSAQHDEARLSSSCTDGHEYQIILIVAVVAIILAGPGRYGLDAGRGWARRPFIGSFVALLLGIGAGVGVWVLLNGANPLA